MLNKYSPQIMERQKERLPEYISALENLSRGQGREQRRVLATVIHDMRNDLAVLSMIFELDALYLATKPALAGV